jgi:hypothetical protein
VSETVLTFDGKVSQEDFERVVRERDEAREALRQIFYLLQAWWLTEHKLLSSEAE